MSGFSVMPAFSEKGYIHIFRDLCPIVAVLTFLFYILIKCTLFFCVQNSYFRALIFPLISLQKSEDCQSKT